MALAVGVDVSETRGLDVVVIDEGRRLAGPPRARVDADALTAVLAELGPDVCVVAIDSPPAPGSGGKARPCEAALRRRGIQIFSTPAAAEDFAAPFYNWVRVGIRAFSAAEAAGFPLLRAAGAAEGHALEVFPHASDVALRGVLPPAGTSRSPRHKLAWRRETLRSAGVADLDVLGSLDAVDAALAALTGLLALDGAVEFVGEEPFLIAIPEHPAARFVRAGALRDAPPRPIVRPPR